MGSETAARLKLQNKFGTQSVESDKRPRGDGRSAAARSLPSSAMQRRRSWMHEELLPRVPRAFDFVLVHL